MEIENITALIVEDNVHSLAHCILVLKDLFPEIKLVGAAENMADALALINENKPEILLLDVDLPDGTGFDILEKIPKGYTPAIVFITGHDDLALKALRAGSVDYLTKPIHIPEFKTAIAKAKKHSINNKANNGNAGALISNLLAEKNKVKPTKLALAHGNKISLVPINTITHLEAEGRYTTFYLENASKIIMSKNLKEYSFLADDNPFEKVHRSFMINLNHVIEFNYEDGGTVLLSNKIPVPVSTRAVSAFVKKLKSHQGLL